MSYGSEHLSSKNIDQAKNLLRQNLAIMLPLYNELELAIAMEALAVELRQKSAEAAQGEHSDS